MTGKHKGILKAIMAVFLVCYAFIPLEIGPSDIGQLSYGHAQILADPMRFATKELARIEVQPKIQEIWNGWKLAAPTKGLRALQHGELLPSATQVKPAFGMSAGAQTLTCENPCWLFFIDKAPGAHFAHPVTIILLDAETGEQQVMDTEWWPEVSGPNTETKQLFKTREMRMNPELIVFEHLPDLLPGIQLQNFLPPSSQGSTTLSQSELNGVLPPICDGCNAWAIIVCGYDDRPDTFDEDTNGIYAVLKSLGLSDDHIFYLSPHAGDLGVDMPTSKVNVQWAIQQVADQACEDDKVLFFYSSHGGIDGLTCIDQGISASELDGWLSAINSKEMAIIIEACHSGSLIGKYSTGAYVAAEDDLTGAGKTKRVVFTSASTDTSSYPDVDGADDPNGPADIGSESIYGYIMAFGIPAADTNGDVALSFAEGVKYALDNDVTLIRGVNFPQFSRTADLDPAKVHHYCYPTSDPNGPYSGACQDGRAEFSLDGSGSSSLPPCDGSLTYAWETDCPAPNFSDPSVVSPILVLSPINQCLECNVWLTVTCSDGSSETRLSTVTTTDTEPPVITCPPDTVIECSAPTAPSATGFATRTDNCDPAAAVAFSDKVTPGACPNARTITRTWSATDGCGNVSSCVQTIEVVDTTVPTVACPADVTIECDQSTDPSNTGLATATDNCDENSLIAYSDAEIPGHCPQEKTVNRTWSATDACGNSSSCVQTIRVVDRTPPVIENIAVSPSSLWAPNHKMVPTAVVTTATDNCDSLPQCRITGVGSNEPVNALGDGNTAPDWVITGSGTVDLRAERSGKGAGRIYTIMVTCTDACGNASIGTSTVTVQHNR
jgi:hypothetical protein